MQSAIAKTFFSRNLAQGENHLVYIATPVLELILQIKAGLTRPSPDLRRTIDGMLKQIDLSADAQAYKEQQIQNTKFALAAFIDETVLTADFPLRDEWEKYPLQLEYFREHLAGEKFFEKLDALLKDAEREADVIEVYYLCLLLGYKGKYNIYLEDQLRGVIENVAECLRRLNRLRTGMLSPHWQVNDQPRLLTDRGLPKWMKIGATVWIGAVVLIFMIFYFLISQNLDSAIKDVLLR